MNYLKCANCSDPARFVCGGGCNNTLYCSDSCAKNHWKTEHFKTCAFIMGGVKRGRREEELLQELEGILREYRDRVRLLVARSPSVGDDIKNSLLQTGVALVEVDQGTAVSLKRLVGTNMANAYPLISDAAKADMREGNFAKFSSQWAPSKNRVYGKDSGMSNPPAISLEYRDLYKHPITNTIHRKNVVSAMNNLQMWELLTRVNPTIHPSNWFTHPLKRAPSFRYQVLDDGVKTCVKMDYKPTSIHYDGQMGETIGMEANRVQVIYCADEGDVRLFAVAGSHTARAKAILKEITGWDQKDQFKAIGSDYPKVNKLLYKYGIALPLYGLLMFAANVWHYEAVKALIDPAEDRAPILRVDTEHLHDIHSYTKSSTIFRIYCGIGAVPSGPLVKDLVVFAYLREHGWAFEAFMKKQKSQFFVSSKSTQYHAFDLTNEDTAEFNQIKKTSMETMKRYLREHVSQQRLELYGLIQSDLEPYDEEQVIESE